MSKKDTSWWSEIHHFKPHEFDSQCGSPDGKGLDNMDEAFVRRLDVLRRFHGKPLRVSSGYRTPKHNAKVSSTGDKGPHTTGKAVDILCHGKDAFTIVHIALVLGFTGVGVQQKGPHASRFIHLDTLEDSPTSPRPWLWTY